MNTLTLTLEATPENLRRICEFFGEINMKVDIPPAKVTAPAAQPADPTVTEAMAPAEEKVITKAEVRAKAIEITKAGKQAELKQVLSDFGAAKLSEIKEIDYSEVYAKLSEVI